MDIRLRGKFAYHFGDRCLGFTCIRPWATKLLISLSLGLLFIEPGLGGAGLNSYGQKSCGRRPRIATRQLRSGLVQKCKSQVLIPTLYFIVWPLNLIA